MLQVMIYAVTIAIAWSVVGFCFERLAIMRGLAQRYIWLTAMVLSVAWAATGVLLAEAPASARPERQLVVTEVVAAPTQMPGSTGVPELEDRQPVSTLRPVDETAWSLPSDQTLLRTWAITSGALLLHLACATLLLHRRASRWQRRTVLGREVLVSESTGPALLGTLRPRIVVPAWFMHEPPATQALILQHEEQHMTARDAVLLRASQLLAILLPWNLPLWWQWRRLRQVVEMDCDARVLRLGAAPSTYGAMLLAVMKHTGSAPSGLIALGKSVPMLERRIRHLLPDPARRSVLRAVIALLFLGGGVGIAVALEAPPPPQAAKPLAPVAPAAQPPSRAQAATPAAASPSRATAPLPLLLPPAPSKPQPDRREIIERMLVERYPELVNGPAREGDALVSIRMQPDGSIEHSEMRFVEANDEAALAAAVASHSSFKGGQLLLARGWQIAGGAITRNQIRVAYTMLYPRERTYLNPADAPMFGGAASFSYADAAKVVAHHLPEVRDAGGTRTGGTAWLILSRDGRVLRSGYGPGNASPAILQEQYPGQRLGQVRMVMPFRQPGSSSEVTLLLAWVEPPVQTEAGP